MGRCEWEVHGLQATCMAMSRTLPFTAPRLLPSREACVRAAATEAVSAKEEVVAEAVKVGGEGVGGKAAQSRLLETRKWCRRRR